MKICRSGTNRWLAGVCGGLAEELGWSPGRVRLVWVVATVLTGFSGVLVYLALWFLMPKAPFVFFERPPMQPWRRHA
jgi:phage shock protein C